jgi:hypothetical protein
MSDPMQSVVFRAPRSRIKMWRARAKQSAMTLSKWLRCAADEGAVYQATIIAKESLAMSRGR